MNAVKYTTGQNINIITSFTCNAALLMLLLPSLHMLEDGELLQEGEED